MTSITSSAPLPTRLSTSQGPNRPDWTRHRPTIKRLYIDEDRTLKEVMEIMKKDHDFFATVKMYKSRLRQWGLSKYIKTNPEDVASLPNLLGEGGNQGTVRLTSGRVVNADRLTTHLLRKKRLSVTANRRGSQPLTSQRADNQISPPSVITIKPPDIFYISEAVLADTNTYVSARLMNRFLVSKGGSAAIVTTFYTIRNHLQDGEHEEAMALLRQAPKQMYTLLRNEPPRILEHLFMMIVHFRDIPGEAISNAVKALIKYAAAVAVDLGWPQQHPLRRILSSFAMLIGQESRAQYDLVARGWKCLMEVLDGQISLPDCYANLATWLDMGESSGYKVLPGASVEGRQCDVYRDIITTHSKGSPEVPKELLYLTELERQRVNARCGFQEDLQRQVRWTLQRIPGKRELIYLYNCELCLANFHKEKKRIDLAERYLRISMDNSFDRYGGQYPYCLLCFIHLEGWLADWAGEVKVAELLKWKTHARAQLENPGRYALAIGTPK